MAWLSNRNGIWWLGYYIDGQLVRKSLGTRDKDAAQRELEKVDALRSAHRAGSALEPLYENLTGKSLPKMTLKEEVESWLREVKASTSPGTHTRYKAAAEPFLSGMKATDKTPLLRDVTTNQLRDYFLTRFEQTSAGTANVERKIMRVFFNRAKAEGVIKSNPILSVKSFRGDKNSRRRAFTAAELTRLYDVAPDDFWRYMLVGGFYTGLRLGDLATLEIQEVDFSKNLISRGMGKLGGKMVHVPIVPLMADKIRAQIGDRTEGPIWPKEAAIYRVKKANYFSQRFYKLLSEVEPPIVPKRDHRRRKFGRNAKHQKSEASFHSLRHTFITFLKTTGATQAVAKELAGHSSDAINDLYTHMPPETLAHAVAQLPQFVK